eukprot:scaffold8151_cov127-Isochrysis_galbana.AAC.1
MARDETREAKRARLRRGRPPAQQQQQNAGGRGGVAPVGCCGAGGQPAKTGHKQWAEERSLATRKLPVDRKVLIYAYLYASTSSSGTRKRPVTRKALLSMDMHGSIDAHLLGGNVEDLTRGRVAEGCEQHDGASVESGSDLVNFHTTNLAGGGGWGVKTCWDGCEHLLGWV